MSENTPMENMGNAPMRDVEPKLCVNQCGFFGNPMTANMCSKCYKSIEKEKDEAKDAEMPQTPLTAQDLSPEAPAFILDLAGLEKAEACEPRVEDAASAECQKDVAMAAASSSSDMAPEEEEPRKEQPKKNRCWSCNKKIGLLGHECRCGYIFCGTHRYAEDHNCDYDFKENGRKHLAEQNPSVSAPKVPKI
eukprot:GEMP01001107.1.p1 GENE.GEMP01001107.1~~GEMP01001107.1.p1  ORF type:complete len:192 (-),score=41.43 GEMP01001107.1:4953-5528(-)